MFCQTVNVNGGNNVFRSDENHPNDPAARAASWWWVLHAVSGNVMFASTLVLVVGKFYTTVVGLIFLSALAAVCPFAGLQFVPNPRTMGCGPTLRRLAVLVAAYALEVASPGFWGRVTQLDPTWLPTLTVAVNDRANRATKHLVESLFNCTEEAVTPTWDDRLRAVFRDAPPVAAPLTLHYGWLLWARTLVALGALAGTLYLHGIGLGATVASAFAMCVIGAVCLAMVAAQVLSTCFLGVWCGTLLGSWVWIRCRQAIRACTGWV
jgi:hypothetical protein